MNGHLFSKGGRGRLCSPGDTKKDMKGLKDRAKNSFGRWKNMSGSCF